MVNPYNGILLVVNNINNKNQAEIHAATQLSLGNIILTERGQSQMTADCIPVIWNVQNWQIYGDRKWIKAYLGLRGWELAPCPELKAIKSWGYWSLQSADLGESQAPYFPASLAAYLAPLRRQSPGSRRSVEEGARVMLLTGWAGYSSTQFTQAALLFARQAHSNKQ